MPEPGEDRKAFDLACRYLTARERSEKQVRDYLARRGFEDEPIRAAIENLRLQRLVDDLRYARLYVESKSRLAPRSGRLLMRELRVRGVDGETAKKAVEELLESVPEEELARRLIEKLPPPTRADRERVAGRLRARGFAPSLALRLAGLSRARREVL